MLRRSTASITTLSADPRAAPGRRHEPASFREREQPDSHTLSGSEAPACADTATGTSRIGRRATAPSDTRVNTAGNADPRLTNRWTAARSGSDVRRSSRQSWCAWTLGDRALYYERWALEKL